MFTLLSHVKVPSAWRPVLEDPSNLQIVFYYYAIAFSLILREFNCSEGAVGVKGSHGFRNLAGSVVHLLGLVGDAITSAEANIFSELGCIERLEEKRCGVSLKKSSRTAAEGLRALVKNDKEKRRGVCFVNVIFTLFIVLLLSATELQDGSALFITVAKYLSPSRHDIDQVGITPDVLCTTDMLTSTRGLSSKDNKGTSSSLEADSCIMAKHQRRHQELTQTISDQLLDDQAVYYKVAGDCPKGCVYSLRSLWRKKRRYVDPDASTSQWPWLRSSLISCHSSVLPCRGPPCSVPRSPAAGPLSSLLSCSSSFLRCCYLLCVSMFGAAAPSLAAAAHSFLPFWSISTELLPVYIDALELPCMLTGLLSRDPYAPYPCIPTETDAEYSLRRVREETMGVRADRAF
ncbi:hypothetical protein Syun_018706 [Stephania yunnanensis]|uniref:Uncharacterized protein n=1 Tax=Stephania yunnanensis TaxID=152371 RepID=A0AAP0NWL8_9MAGN